MFMEPEKTGENPVRAGGLQPKNRAPGCAAMAQTAIIVPCRLESTRFPRKLLHVIKGKPLLLWVAERIAREANVASNDQPPAARMVAAPLEAPPLTEEEIAVMRRWIDAGAGCSLGSLDGRRVSHLSR